MKYETYEAGIKKTLDILLEDWYRWTNGRDFSSQTPEFYVTEGRNYDKIIKVDRNGSQCVVGFVAKKDNPKKNIFVGDLLKAASWNAPATNFTRGTIANEESIRRCVQWCGIQ